MKLLYSKLGLSKLSESFAPSLVLTLNITITSQVSETGLSTCTVNKTIAWVRKNTFQWRHNQVSLKLLTKRLFGSFQPMTEH